MPYDEKTAQRIRAALKTTKGLTEKKMFGGIAFLLNGNMCCGVVRDMLMLRVGPEEYDHALSQPHARPMDFTGRPLTGFVYVAPEGFATSASLKLWLSLALKLATALPAKRPAKTTRKSTR